jgi:hypothetical protein
MNYEFVAVIISVVLTNSVHELLMNNHASWRRIYIVLTALTLITSDNYLIQQDSAVKLQLNVLDMNVCFLENKTFEIESYHQKHFSSIILGENDQSASVSEIVPDGNVPTEEEHAILFAICSWNIKKEDVVIIQLFV